MKPSTDLQSILPAAVDLRHRLHRIPELNYEERETADLVRQTLRAMGIDFVAGVGDAPTATVAVIGDPSKPCVALRADIDGLPITERTGLAYASTHAGKMHACGHDGHIATLFAAAANIAAQSAKLPVCVKLIFQPAEEGGAGADRLVRGGVLDGRVGPKVVAIFGLHGWPGMPVGTISTKPGALLAATDNFHVTIRGRGCHGAYPHLGRDPIVVACETVLNLQQIVSREFDPTEPIALTVGQINAGTAPNIIPDEARLIGTVRTLGGGARTLARAAIERRCRAIAAAAGCEIGYRLEEGYPVTDNHPTMAAYVTEVAKAAFGAEHFATAGRPSMGGEDFAFYLQHVPGCFFFIGVQSPDRPTCPPLHNDQFDFTDAAIPVGAKMFVELVSRFDPARLPG